VVGKGLMGEEENYELGKRELRIWKEENYELRIWE
jgi:hypothetical protein